MVGSSDSDGSSHTAPAGRNADDTSDRRSQPYQRPPRCDFRNADPAGRQHDGLDAAQFLPTGWRLTYLSGLGDDGTVLGYAYDKNTVGHGFMLKRAGVSGTVYGVECGATSCRSTA